MKVRVFALVGVVLAAVVIAMACGGGGDGELSLEDYFQRFRVIQERIGQRMEALAESLSGEFDSAEEEIKANQEFFAASSANLRDFVHALKGLDPPVDVESLHEKTVEVLADGAQISEDIAERLEDIESTVEMKRVLELTAPDLASLSERGAAGCLALQDIADKNGLAVNLQCED